MLYIARFVPLFLGTVLLVAASLGCSFWFFYSFLDNDADQMIIEVLSFELPVLPVVAGCVGCGAQLFVYSFAANLAHIQDLLFKGILVVISTMTIGLSMLSTYSTLISFLESKSQMIAHNEFLTTQRQKIIESRNSDLITNSLSAEQAITDRYRTQSKGLTETNEALRAQQLEELDNFTTTTKKAASPLDGLVRVVGNDALVSALFCAWLAITFDLLPILGITLLGRLSLDTQKNKRDNILSDGRTALASNEEKMENPPMEEVKTSAKKRPDNKLNGHTAQVGTPTSNGQEISVDLPTTTDHLHKPGKDTQLGSMDENTQNRMIQEIIHKKPIYSDLPVEFQKIQIGDIPTDIIYPIITKYLSDGTIPLSYAGVGDFTGLSKWKVQQYFTKAVEERFLVNKTRENIDAGYEFSKTVRYNIKRNIDLEAVLHECQQW